MAFLQFSQVSLAFGDRDILKNITLNLGQGSKAALTGANGSGKTTLMKVMTGLIPCDSGQRAVQKGSRIAYLPQAGIVHEGVSLRQEADAAFSEGYELSRRLDDLGDLLASAEYAQNDAKNAPLLEEYHDIQTRLEDSGWHRRSVLAEQVLLGLGFTAGDMDRPVHEFSGGWQMRIALAKILLEKPDILLLDEPTNYLDLEARNWLEDWLKEFSGGFLVVSHDRYFLDVTINEVYELFNGELHRYPGNYTHYEQVREVELQSLIARYRIQQEEIKKLEDFVRRFRYKATKAAAAQEKLKILDKMERIEIPESLKKMHFSFPPAPHSGRLVLTLKDIQKAYPVEGGEPHQVIKHLDLVVEKGERLVVAGRNGAGKSTLLRILASEDKAFSGEVALGAGVSIGYFSQDNAEQMKGEQSIIDMMESEAPLELIPKIRDMLGSFLFRGDDVYKTVSVLSGGEKSRLALLRLLLRPVNLLILDEPTNHLDLSSKDVLLEALKKFNGTIIFVSHDRGFIQGLATKVLELSPSRHRLFPGDYTYYLERLAAEAAGLVGLDNAAAVPVAAGASTAKTTSTETATPSSWEESKRLKSERRKLEREEEKALNELTEAEEKLSLLNQELSDPAVYSDHEKSRKVQQQIEQTEALVEELTAAWERAADQLIMNNSEE